MAIACLIDCIQPTIQPLVHILELENISFCDMTTLLIETHREDPMCQVTLRFLSACYL